MNGHITNDERTMLRDYILLPHIEAMVQRSIDDIERSGNVLKRLYAAAGTYIQRQIAEDTRRLRAELKRANIRILGEEHTDFILYTEFNCRGQTERFGLTRDVMRSEISVRLTQYVAEFGAAIADVGKRT
ncbi:hypothetical protein [Paenibacillus graminis]|uniref:hypothetical protein n=1 Tax=Paenibacillus graminis TaxID=189425 RepID=UPI002DBDAE80|nr:hypothetical protein [Paenibacillus graminis]MEC0167873.1 hypothetical protein [Paenibacillus graminis]